MQKPTDAQWDFMDHDDTELTQIGTTVQGNNEYAIEAEIYVNDQRVLYRLDVHKRHITCDADEIISTVFCGDVVIKGNFICIDTYVGHDPIEMSRFLRDLQKKLGPYDDSPKHIRA